MNAQRGFRRIVLAMSVAVFVASLAFGGYTMKRISDRRALIAMNERVAILRREEDVRIQKEFAGRTNTLEASLARNPFLETTPVSIAPSWWDWNLGVIGIIMGVLSGALAALPWVLFYLVAWIVRGFS
ncbi:MAG: hypothetical protein HY217_06165 [Candidatus Rokubacteria bacterium]|nr:hypothetical protein [Candidatus Rokubacteria bacterium]